MITMCIPDPPLQRYWHGMLIARASRARAKHDGSQSFDYICKVSAVMLRPYKYLEKMDIKFQNVTQAFTV